MKTLDEVIMALDACQRSACEQCPYYDPNVDICDDVAQADALHYLKEYKKLDSLDAIAFPEDDNEPLTWKELKQMKGKPVFVEMDGYKPNWGIVMNQDKRNGRLLLCGYDEVVIRIELNEEGEGIGWQAYRKERTE